MKLTKYLTGAGMTLALLLTLGAVQADAEDLGGAIKHTNFVDPIAVMRKKRMAKLNHRREGKRRRAAALQNALKHSKKQAHRKMMEAWKRRENARYNLQNAPSSQWYRNELHDATKQLQTLVADRLAKIRECDRAWVQAGGSYENWNQHYVGQKKHYGALLKKTFGDVDPDSQASAATWRMLATPCE